MVREALIKWRKENPERVKELGRIHDSKRLRNPLRIKAKRVYSKAYRDSLDKPVVYVWMAPDGKADYVGRGSLRRPMEHRYRKAIWWTLEHCLMTMTCDSEWQAMELEGRWGAYYLPRYNKEGYRHGNNS